MNIFLIIHDEDGLIAKVQAQNKEEAYTKWETYIGGPIIRELMGCIIMVVNIKDLHRPDMPIIR